VATADVQDVQPVHGATTEDCFEADLLRIPIFPEERMHSAPLAAASLEVGSQIARNPTVVLSVRPTLGYHPAILVILVAPASWDTLRNRHKRAFRRRALRAS
jgi:hypothetical protein